MDIRIKRVYDPPEESDGVRILVDRLWPRGLARAGAQIDAWEKEVAPSDALRRFFGHDLTRWEEFQRRYRAELRESPAREALERLAERARRSRVTLLYAARDPAHNNAVVLSQALEDSVASG